MLGVRMGLQCFRICSGFVLRVQGLVFKRKFLENEACMPRKRSVTKHLFVFKGFSRVKRHWPSSFESG